MTGTGLTHLGSAATRDAMHQKVAEAAEETLTDSMKMFRMGLEGGKPKRGKDGVQPEWFYKGDGSFVAAPGAPLVSPGFAADGGEEPEVAGIYVIGTDGTPFRVGFALMNEFSDHVTERANYLLLAHSKLRPCSFGPELLLGDLPEDIRGTSRIRRGKKVIFEQPFLTGEANMSPHRRQSRGAPLQVSVVPPPGRHPCPLLRHGDPLLRRRRCARRRAMCSRSRRRSSACRSRNPLAIAKKKKIAVKAL